MVSDLTKNAFRVDDPLEVYLMQPAVPSPRRAYTLYLTYQVAILQNGGPSELWEVSTVLDHEMPTKCVNPASVVLHVTGRVFWSSFVEYSSWEFISGEKSGEELIITKAHLIMRSKLVLLWNQFPSPCVSINLRATS